MVLRKASEIAAGGTKRKRPTRAQARAIKALVVEEIPTGSTSAQARSIFRGNILRAVSQKDLVTGLVRDLRSLDHRERSEARKFVLAFVNKDGGTPSGEEETPEMDAILGAIGEKKAAGKEKAEAEPMRILEEEMET
jgi:hypothetical protein